LNLKAVGSTLKVSPVDHLTKMLGYCFGKKVIDDLEIIPLCPLLNPFNEMRRKFQLIPA
jgi:hypothetical protein